MLALFLFVVTASHGVLDAMTNGGLGVAFFAPFTSARYFLPFRPVQVSPISLAAFFTHRGVDKNLEQLYRICLLLGLDLERRVRAAA
jgi:inner membrane protein